MKPRTLILMGVAVVCGLVASYLTSRMLAQQGTPQEQAKVLVLVAKAKIPYGTQIKEPEKFFITKEFPSGTEPKRALRTLDQVKDRRVNKNLGAEVFVTEDDLMTKADEGAAGIISTGMRAFAISVKSDTSVAGFVLPLMRVDVVGTIRTNQGPMGKTLLQNVLVLGVDSNLGRKEGEQNVQSNTVTLQVKPEEAEMLNAALATGELRLTLRPDGDTKVVKTPGFRASDLLKEKVGKGEGTGDGETEGSDPTGSPIAKVPSVPDAAPAASLPPPPPPEPTTVTHTITFINGQTVNKHRVILDKKTMQPVETGVDKPEAESELSKPKTDKPEAKGEPKGEAKGEAKGETKGDAKSEKPAAEASEVPDEVK